LAEIKAKAIAATKQSYIDDAKANAAQIAAGNAAIASYKAEVAQRADAIAKKAKLDAYVKGEEPKILEQERLNGMYESARELKIDLVKERQKAIEAKAAEDAARAAFWKQYEKEHNIKQAKLVQQEKEEEARQAAAEESRRQKETAEAAEKKKQEALQAAQANADIAEAEAEAKKVLAEQKKTEALKAAENEAKAKADEAKAKADEAAKAKAIAELQAQNLQA
jgi:colicin import membrane protein